MRRTLILIVMALFLSIACSMPTSYYTNPNSGGYHQQKLGGICEKCGKMFLFSGHQLHHLTNVRCAYCNHSQNVRAASERWVLAKQQQDNRALAESLGAAMRGFAKGYSNRGSSRSSSSAYSNRSNSCSSDYDCGVGNHCVKAQYSSTGTCMKSVNEYGNQIQNMPNPNSIGVNKVKRCTFDTDCPPGFSCDPFYNTCVKR